jgi:protease I
MARLDRLKVAVLVTDGLEEAELAEPTRALGEAGANVAVIAPQDGQVQAFRHHDKSKKFDVDMVLDQVVPPSLDALLLPGGALNAGALRAEANAQAFIREMDEAGKPIATICHAGWELISAGAVPAAR